VLDKRRVREFYEHPSQEPEPVAESLGPEPAPEPEPLTQSPGLAPKLSPESAATAHAADLVLARLAGGGPSPQPPARTDLGAARRLAVVRIQAAARCRHARREVARRRVASLLEPAPEPAAETEPGLTPGPKVEPIPEPEPELGGEQHAELVAAAIEVSKLELATRAAADTAAAEEADRVKAERAAAAAAAKAKAASERADVAAAAAAERQRAEARRRELEAEHRTSKELYLAELGFDRENAAVAVTLEYKKAGYCASCSMLLHHS
jgi:hypothetical protein